MINYSEFGAKLRISESLRTLRILLHFKSNVGVSVVRHISPTRHLATMAGAELRWKSWRFSQSNRKSIKENPGILLIDELWTLTMISISKSKTSLWFGCTCRKVNGIFCPFKAWVSKEEIEDGVFKFILNRTVGTHNHPSNNSF